MIAASAIGYYGPWGIPQWTNPPPGAGFAAALCGWEAEEVEPLRPGARGMLPSPWARAETVGFWDGRRRFRRLSLGGRIGAGARV